MGLFQYISEWYKEKMAIPKDQKVKFTASTDLMEKETANQLHEKEIVSSVGRKIEELILNN